MRGWGHQTVYKESRLPLLLCRNNVGIKSPLIITVLNTRPGLHSNVNVHILLFGYNITTEKRRKVMLNRVKSSVYVCTKEPEEV